MSLWKPTHILSIREPGGGPERCIEVMILPSRVTEVDGAAAYTEIEWRAQIPPTWARTPLGRWLRRHDGRMLAFHGAVTELQVPAVPCLGHGIPRRFLIVDDDPGVAQAFARAVRMRTKSWIPLIAKSAVEALKQADVVSVHGIVADRAMPGMDGRELLLEFRRRHPESARILLTGSGSIAEFPAAHRVLRKPCPASVVVSILDSVMMKAAS